MFSDLKTAENRFSSIPAAQQPDQEKDLFYPLLGWQDHQRPRVPDGTDLSGKSLCRIFGHPVL